MVLMKNTRATTITFTDNTREFTNQIIGIKGDPITAEAKDIKIVDEDKLGVTTVREAVDMLADITEQMAVQQAANATAAATSISTLENKVDKNREEAAKESLKNALLF